MPRTKTLVALCIAFASMMTIDARGKDADPGNLAVNGDFQLRSSDGRGPADYELHGAAIYQYLGDPARDVAGWGVALQSGKDADDRAGFVAQTINGIDAKEGRWFRFTFRGLPEDNFAVERDGLYMEVENFGDAGRTALDGKVKRLYELIEQDRKNLTVNGDHHVGGAAVWRTYQLDFWLPFPQVDQLRLSVGFEHGSARRAAGSNFFVTDFRLVRIDGPDLIQGATTRPDAGLMPRGKLLPLGGRWFYAAEAGEAEAPKIFGHGNADRLFYHDDKWTTPFAGEMSAWLRAGDKDADGNVLKEDRFVPDNVTVSFDDRSMIIHTKGIPNHPTGKFPETGSGRRNPSYIQEQDSTYYIPTAPRENPNHLATTLNNSNHALPMGPIGIAANGVVFFNPFDAGSMDASNMMDRCCGHPNPDNLYHYHKYPICMYSPWADEGTEHSPVIGWAFDGFPIYGPYAAAGVMAKDVKGPGALNEFNIHQDKDRGWHYQVTPGKFPYIIGGYWGTEDPRDRQRPRHPRGSQGGQGSQNRPGRGNAPPPGRDGPPGGEDGPPPPPDR